MAEEQINQNEQEAEVANPEDLRAQRLRKMQAIKDAGGNPYGHRVDGIVDSVAAKAAYVDENIEVIKKIMWIL